MRANAVRPLSSVTNVYAEIGGAEDSKSDQMCPYVNGFVVQVPDRFSAANVGGGMRSTLPDSGWIGPSPTRHCDLVTNLW